MRLDGTAVRRFDPLVLVLAALLAVLLVGLIVVAVSSSVRKPAGPTAAAPVSTSPVVAVHVSERTAALGTMAASAATPTGSGTTGKQWWITSWRYFVAYRSLEAALEADGTPFVEVSDADIAAGELLTTAGSPRYPIVVSLAAEAVADDVVAGLRAYASAGGFVMAGSSSFTRNPGGATRGDFALGSEMGVRMTTASLDNWTLNDTFTKTASHRLTADIPSGALFWGGKPSDESIPWDRTAPNEDQTQGQAMRRQVWRVTNTDAQVLATGDGGVELATKAYGDGWFIYDAELQPLLGDTGYSSSAFAYTIYRNAIEWAFEAAGMPIVKVSPWQYPYDAAGVVRHDFEAHLNPGQSILDSARYEHSLGMRGDYYFTTQTLRIGSLDTRMTDAAKRADIDNLRTAVSAYGATVGSHNGGLVNPSGQNGDENYLFHWGPDEALDRSPPGYASGQAYARASLSTSFQDIETWMGSSPYSGASGLARLDNGRAGCGAADNCPRIFVSPLHNAGRDRSRQILEGLGAQVVGEQKVGPFPIRGFSYRKPNTDYPMVCVGVGSWYVNGEIAGTVDPYLDTPNLRAAVDWYYDLGGLINLYSHTNAQPYVAYLAGKPNLWKTNAVGVRDWYLKREPVTVTPSFTRSGSTWTATATITGSTDSQTAVELTMPLWARTMISLNIRLNGAAAPAGTWRVTDDGLKIKVGTAVTSIEVAHGPVVTVPADITVPATGAAGAAVTYNATAVDNSGGPLTPTCSPASGSTFPVGTTTVTCVATDSIGTASKAFRVTVTAPAATPAPLGATDAPPAGA